MTTRKIELSVGAVKYSDPNEIFTEEELNNIKNKIPELYERVGIIEQDVEEINSSLDNKANKDDAKNLQTQINNLVINGDGTQNLEVVQARGSYQTLNDRLTDFGRKKILKTSKNLFNLKDVLTGKQLSYFDGSRLPVYSDNGGKNIVFIPVLGNTEYTISWAPKGDGDSMSISQVDVDKKQVAGTSTTYMSDVKTITTNANTKYFLLSMAVKHNEDTQVELGATKTDYEPYFDDVVAVEFFSGLNTTESLECFNDVEILKRKLSNITNVVCWGDSLTWGAGADTNTSFSKYTYPSVLSNLIGSNYNVTNYGIGGENASMIGARQGGYPYIVEPFTIPEDTSKVEIKIKTINGANAYPLKQTEWGTGVNTGKSISINPCIIDGVEGILSASEDIKTYYFNRSVEGFSKVIKRPTPLLTNAHINKRDNIQIIWIGTNGGYNNDEDELIRIIKAMIDNTDLVIQKYIVIGLTYKVATTLDTLMEKNFGRHFINIRSYISYPIYDSNNNIISCYGLDDKGITPTESDLTAISQGKIPPSLLSDSTHFNIAGYDVIANQVYKRGVELRYW